MSEKGETWSEFGKRCERAMKLLGVTREIAPLDTPTWIQGTSLDLNHRADVACDRYLLEGEWPDLDKDLRLLLFLRLLYVATYAIHPDRRASPVVPSNRVGDFFLTCMNLSWYMEWNRWAESYFQCPVDLPFDPWKLNS